MDQHYEALIIGSGFGGSVVAFELANAGLRVLLLERGRAYPPGSFPRSPREVARNFWDPSKRLYGLFDVWSFRKSEAIIASGLGGGSLIYANVLIRKPAEWFECGPTGRPAKWPLSYGDLQKHYTEVERVLGANPFPIEDLPANATVKAQAFETAAKAAGFETWRPPLAVAFHDNQGVVGPGLPIISNPSNLHDAPRNTCRYCGECDMGCNYGSKNSLDFNYLTDAKRLGAELQTLCEVREILPLEHEFPERGYEVRFVVHQPESNVPSSKLETKVVTTDRLILAAGTLGSTYLLLKNHANFPRLSHCLGSGYSTNGDILAFAWECRMLDDLREKPRVLDASRGPVITATARVNFTRGEGGMIQDAGYPEFVNWVAEAYDVNRLWPRIARFAVNRLLAWWTGDPQSEVGREVFRLLGPSILSSTSQPLLGMGCDRANGRMRLRSRRGGKRPVLDIDWSKRQSRACIGQLTAACHKIADKLGGSFAPSPLTRFLHRLITVHPLGGCPMGMTSDEGVVDRCGQVFNYPGLYVADGSIMPGPVGCNPSLTIAAIARHIAMEIVATAARRTR